MMQDPISRNLHTRWRRLRAFLASQQGVDLNRFEASVAPLGQVARRLLVTCWERVEEQGFRGALRLLLSLRRSGQRLAGFVLPTDRPFLWLEVRGPDRRLRQVRLSREALHASGNELELIVREAVGGRAAQSADRIAG